MKPTRLPWAWYALSLFLVMADQVTKLLVRAYIPLDKTFDFIPGVLGLTHLRNTGAAFSILSEHTWLLTVISVVASVGLAVAMGKKWLGEGFLAQLALSLVLGGAVGNLIDRAFLGYVTDMLATLFMNFPVFNVADICVTVGVALLAVSCFLPKRGEGDDLGADPSSQ